MKDGDIMICGILRKDMCIREFCEPCVLGKSSRLSFWRRETAKELPQESWCRQMCVGHFPSSITGYKYLVVYKVAHSRSQGNTVESLLSDNGGKFNNSDVQNIFVKHGGILFHILLNIEMTKRLINSNKNVQFPKSLRAIFKICHIHL